MRRAARKRKRGTPHSLPPVPTPIEYVGVGAAATGDAPATLNPGQVSGVLTGDLLILAGATRASTTGEVQSVPAGWTDLFHSDDDAELLNFRLCYRLAASDGEAAPTVTWNNLDAGDAALNQIAAFRYVDPADPIGVVGILGTGPAGTQADIGPIPGITLDRDGCMVIVGGAQRNDATDMNTLTGAYDWFEIALVAALAAPNPGEVSWAWQAALAAQAEVVSAKTLEMTVGGTPSWGGVMFAINPDYDAVAPTYDITVALDPSDTGRITGPGIDTDGNDFTGTYPGNGTQVELTAHDGGGVLFDGWSGDATGTDNPLTVEGNTDKNITGSFSLAPLGDAVVPGTGSVVKQDLMGDADWRPDWIKCSTSFQDTVAVYPDPQIEHRTTDPDPHVRVGGGLSTGYYRMRLAETRTVGAQARGSTLTVANTTGTLTELSTFPPAAQCSVYDGVTPQPPTLLGSFSYTSKSSTQLFGCTGWDPASGTIPDGSYVRAQSVYDAGVPNTQYRTQLVRNSTVSTFHVYREGETKITYLSIRMIDPWPSPGSTVGVTSQLMQIKQTASGGGSPILSMNEYAEGVDVRTNDPVFRRHVAVPCERNTWLRFALAVHFSQNPAVGWLELWGDPTGSGTLEQLTSRIYTQTVVTGGNAMTLSVGPYQRMERTAVWRDYANIQVCEFEA